ncbi:MAG: isoleucine--tRNA ligase [Deltaproteobacteria bacterium]|nr:isoleucine--tRNA ligase [Deltaproteobacteria bacterium]
MDYKSTLNLPKTDFPMKADLPAREPAQVAAWLSARVYERMRARRQGGPRFVLHDGPPYANGHIHFGHILNKVLKDIVVKSRAMAGCDTPFIPGWDCHGLPIELQAVKELCGVRGSRSEVGASNFEPRTSNQIRQACRAYAERFIAVQREEFQRLGCFGLWDAPYRTMDYAYQAAIAREFATCVERGLVYTGLKSIHWCASCRTALAEAEIEYENHASPSIYVKFLLREAEDLCREAGIQQLPVSLVIWTTTPWTIPANLGLALREDYSYVLVEVQTANDGQRTAELWIVAETLLPTIVETIGARPHAIRGRVRAADLERRHARHPLLPRDSLVVLAEHVTLEAGTGVVHIAPGHGQDDFLVGQRYGLPPLSPVDAAGRFTAEVGIPSLVGQSIWKANPAIIEFLREAGALVHAGQIAHQYPHCWRCKKPILFRATEQWFIGMEAGDLRRRAVAAIDQVEWIPPWGKNRILGMLENRPDWCISRQRIWGVPIIAVTCEACGKRSTSATLVRHVAERFESEGADAWFAHPIETLLPRGYACAYCKTEGPFRKETDILDVWFDSGISFAAVLESQAGLAPRADLYLEGSDQHRGWFHSALLLGVGTRDAPPYRTVLTHGFVVDHEGRKYSKSAKNYVPPETLLNKYGAEVLRLWVAAEDYRNDIRVSDEIVARCAEAYRKIRNTLRFLLGNLADFDPARDAVPETELPDLDRWVLEHARRVIARCRAAYEAYEFHVVYHALSVFCTVELSSFYLDIVKDRLYCEAAAGGLRRAAQTACWRIAEQLTRLMAPILSFTAEEVWGFLPKQGAAADPVFLADLPSADGPLNAARAARWERFRALRGEAAKALEAARKAKAIGSALEARLVIAAEGETRAFLASFGADLADYCIVSEVVFGTPRGEFVLQSEVVPGLVIGVEKMTAAKCARCWKLNASVGCHPTHPDLCSRCTRVVG